MLPQPMIAISIMRRHHPLRAVTPPIKMSPMMRSLAFSLAALVLLTHFATGQTTAPVKPSGDWPIWRHDTRLTGYQPTPGAMTRPPRVVAKLFLGASPGVVTFADLSANNKA